MMNDPMAEFLEEFEKFQRANILRTPQSLLAEIAEKHSTKSAKTTKEPKERE